ncbi:MAG: hypothetical protein U1F49_18125 [Rubrivivax sp.]
MNMTSRGERMRITIRHLFAACASAALALAAGVVSAQTTLKMAHIYNPGNIWYDTAEAYAKAVEARARARSRS